MEERNAENADPGRWARIEELFARALDVPEHERGGFLAIECGGDASLHAELVSLLGSTESAGESLRQIIGGAIERSAKPAAPSSWPGRLANRFTIVRQLGAGGMGVVLEAFDDQRQEVVALKTLERMEPQAIYDLKREFRALTEIIHPRVVRLHELHSDGERWFFAMQKIDGVPFLEHVRRDARIATDATQPSASEPGRSPTHFAGGALDEPALRTALRDLVDGVRAIHRAGKLHRDLKPSNVLVANGRAVILDFGLARPSAVPAERSVDFSIAGTPAYMAPEQATPEGTCAASDWYAVGVMLYEALTGTWPYTGSAHVVLAAKREGTPPTDPRTRARNVPDDLAELAMQLLAIDPSARPGEAEIVAIVGQPEDRVVEPLATAEAGLFVGREKELAQLRKAYDTIRAGGAPVFVRIDGASGIGKSALVARFLDTLPGEPIVLRGRCYERESVPFKALDAIVDALSRHLARLGRVAAAKLTPRHARELCQVFPVLRRVPTFADEVLVATVDPNELRRRAFMAFEELVARIAANQPLVIAIDDLQWGDVDSAALLSQLLDPPEPSPVLWLLSYRTDDQARSVLLQRIAELADRKPATTRTLSLGALPEDDARALARMHLAAGDDPELAVSIAKEAAGSPFFIGELALRRQPRDHADAAERDMLAELVQQRVAALPDDARALLEVVSIAGRPISLAAAVSAAGTPDDASLPSLRAGSLVRFTGTGLLETYHDRIREAVASSLAPDDRKRRHLALAETLEAVDGSDDSAEVLSLHFREAGASDKAFGYTVNAAKHAVTLFAFERAAALYQIAIDLATHGGMATNKLEQSHGDALAACGRGPEAADAYLRASVLASKEEALDLERRAAQQLLISGHLARGLALARRVGKSMGLWIPTRPWLALFIAMFRVAIVYLRAFRNLPHASSDTPLSLLRYDTARGLYEGLALSEASVGFYFGSSIARRGVGLADPVRRAQGLAVSGLLMPPLRGKYHPREVGWLQRARELAIAAESPETLIMAVASEGAGRFCVGDWSKARSILAEAEHLAAMTPGSCSMHVTMTQIFHTWSLFYVGSFAELASRAPRLLVEAKAKNDRVLANAHASAFGPVAWLVRDDVRGANREIDDAQRRWPTEGVQLQHHWLEVGWSLVALYSGDAVGRYDAMVARWSAFRRAQLLRLKVSSNQLVHLRAALAIVAANQVGEGTRANRLRREAARFARRLAKNPMRGSRALAQCLQAALAGNVGDRARQQGLLELAIREFDAADMAGHAAAARWRLGALVGGENGARGCREAEEWFRGQGVVRPERFVSMLAPGFD